MGQMVAYKSLKTMENYKTITPNWGRGGLAEVAIHKRFYLQGFD